MTMYDELIERLRETSVYFGESDDVSVMMIEAANAIDELSHIQIAPEKIIQTMWIPVTERLPEDRSTVLATVGGVVCAAFYGNYKWAEVETYSIFYPTHWMPIPQPPESEGE